jgi:coenzyme F420-reducing hydrogenase delta subunit
MSISKRIEELKKERSRIASRAVFNSNDAKQIAETVKAITENIKRLGGE